MKQNINNKAVNIVELPYSTHQLEEYSPSLVLSRKNASLY